jgi:hypothetical protein
MAESCQSRSGSGHFGRIQPNKWLDPSRFGQIRPASDHGRIPEGIWSAGLGDVGQISPDSDAGRFSVAGCCRIPASARFQLLTIAGFRQLDIKHACKNEEYNFEKQFTIFKIVNRFPKIKETFTVKMKMISVDHYFRPYQTP